MKKIRDIFISLIVFVVFACISFNLYNSLDDSKERKSIQDALPTAQEQSEFQNLLSDNTYYYYNHLNKNDKEVYVTLYSAIMRFDESVTLPTDELTLRDIFTAVLYDNPHIFWVEHDYEYILNEFSLEFKPHYRFNITEANLISKQIDERINAIVSSANKFSSEYEKELYIHNFVCQNTVYDENVDGNTVYDVLINGRAVCEGYSKTVQILLDELDINNYLVVGESYYEGELGAHMWNIVTIDNMNYHLDSTWNDSDSNDEIIYFYFNISDELIEKDHFNISPSDNLCNSDDANYYRQNGVRFDSYNGFQEHTNRSADILRKGDNEIEFVFEEISDFKDAVNDIENDNGFFTFVSEVINKSGRRIDLTKISYITITEHNYLRIIFKEG